METNKTKKQNPVVWLIAIALGFIAIAIGYYIFILAPQQQNFEKEQEDARRKG